MSLKRGSRTSGLLAFLVVVAAAVGGWSLVSGESIKFQPDRQLAQRQLVPTPSPWLITQIAAGDTTADREVGQPDFLHNGANFVDAESLNTGSVQNGVAVDQSSIPNHVYVADQTNNRVLGWVSVSALVNGKSATIVIGQPDFFSSAANYNGITASGLSGPAGISVDSSGNLYVADSSNNRVLEYNTPFTATGIPGSGDAIADGVFGQSDNFTNNTANTGPNGLNSPFGVALDSMGNLYIADYNNSRVLEYDSPEFDSTADRVFGQSGSFFSTTCNLGGVTTANTLCNPTGVASDSSGNLYIADYNNSRVLEYNTPLTTNTTADRVIGQSGLTGSGCDSLGNNALSMCFPRGVILDGADRLYVTDQSNQRVLVYNTPLTSASANVVFGQNNNMTGTTCNIDSVVDNAGLCNPSYAALDSAGDLFVTDSSNNRVLKYNTPLTTNTIADIVLGQPDFSHSTANEPDASSHSTPSWVAIDKSVNPPKLYIADTANNRVLGYNSATSFANGAPADIVIGQPDFFSVGCNAPASAVSATNMCTPQGVAVDKHGNLYVADQSNSRVLEYDAPITTNKAAHLVFGQLNLTTFGCNSPGLVNSSALCSPFGVAVDASDNVYVVDQSNQRVLKYNTPLTTNTVADNVLGQSTFAASQCNQGGTLTGTTLCTPVGIAVDSSANVYVSDSSNQRVLKYLAPITNGKAASIVLGAANLTTTGCQVATSPQTLCNPLGVALDSVGRVYVGDNSEQRIVEFNTPIVTNESASRVFGQGGNFTTGASNMGAAHPNANTLSYPVGVALDGANNLYAADSNNNRVLGYIAPLAAPTATPTPAPSLSFTPPSLAFGNIATGNSSVTKQVVVKNLGTQQVLINAVSPSGPNAGDFARTNNCIGALAGGASCTIMVTFTPSAVVGTAESATLNLWDSAASSPQHVTLSGTSASPATLAPSPLAFGSVATGNTSLAKVVTLANNQSVALTAIAISFGGTNPADFAQTNTCTTTLAAFSTCTISIKFTPAAAGARSGTVVVHDSASNSPQSATLTGTGAVQVSVTAGPIAMGNAAVGSSSPTKTAQVFNNQSVALTISSISIGGTNPGDFSQTNTCGASVAAFSNCTITVTFKPTATGARSATISVADSPDTASPHSIGLTGTGTNPVTVSPTSLVFATQLHGTTSAAKIVTLTNNQGQTLLINSVSIGGTNPGDFAQTNTCGIAIAAFANCTVSVTFTPATTGARAATLSISDSPDVNSPENVSLSGTGS